MRAVCGCSIRRRWLRQIDRAAPVRRFLEREDPCWRALLGVLRRREGEVDGSKAFVDVLFLSKVAAIWRRELLPIIVGLEVNR